MIRRTAQPTTTLQIKPDRALSNADTDKLADALRELYSPPIKRVQTGGGAVAFHPRNVAFWEIELAKASVTFFLTVPEAWGSYASGQLHACWPRATVAEVADSKHLHFDTLRSDAGTLELGQHYYFGLQVDRRELAPLPQLLEITRTMQDGDRIVIQWVLDPAGPDWSAGAQEAAKTWAQGGMPRRTGIDGAQLVRGAVRLVANVALEAQTTIAEFLTDEEIKTEYVPDADRAGLLRSGPLSRHTITKTRFEAFNVTGRVLVQGDSPERRKTQIRAVCAAYNSLTAENYFVVRPQPKPAKLIQAARRRSAPAVKINPDYLSTAEVGCLLRLPPWSLQQEYPVDNIATRETAVPESMTRGGLYIGDVTVRGDTTQAYQPVEPKYWEDICRADVVIGGTGSGKTLGRGAGKGADALRHGFSVFAIDVADMQLCNAIRDTLPADFPTDHIIDLDFGNLEWPIYLNFSEVARSGARARDVANNLSVQVLSYLQKFADEAGDRTARYLRAAAKAVFTQPEATLLDVILMLTSSSYREKLVPTLSDPRLKDIWDQFDELTESMQQVIVGPVLSRLDALTEEDRIANCLFQRPKGGAGRIDFRKWADGDERGPYCVLLRVPKAVLLEDPTDAIVTWLIAKVWLAVLTRIDTAPGDRRPAFLIMDEPHQFLGSAKGGVKSTWGQMLTEARKWRLGLTFLFHDWAQIQPRELKDLIKASLAHYSIYSTDNSATFYDLADKIRPFTPEEASELPRHYAINSIMVGGEYHTFLAHMAAPPMDTNKMQSWRHDYIDRSARTIECSKIFGRPRDEVEADIYERERVLWQEAPKKKRR